jgi:hypothetical protein
MPAPFSCFRFSRSQLLAVRCGTGALLKRRMERLATVFEGFHTNAPKGVMSDGTSPAARTLSPSPNATDGAMCRHEARGGGHWVLTAGLVRYFYGVSPPARWIRLNLTARPEVLTLYLPRGPNRGTGR